MSSHFHQAVEFIKVEEGHGEIFINTARFAVSKGDVIFIPSRCVHAFNGLNPNCEIVGFVFEYTLIPPEVLPVSADTLFNNGIAKGSVFRPSHPYHKIVSSCVDNAVHEYHRSQGCSKLRILAEILKLTDGILKYWELNEEANENYKRLEPVIKYIQKNYHRTITVSELSEIIHVCDGHLIRLFKKATNRTPVNYITDCRIEEALKLLIASDRSVSEIADLVGFSNVNYMIKVFKKNLDATPLKYRNIRR